MANSNAIHGLPVAIIVTVKIKILTTQWAVSITENNSINKVNIVTSTTEVTLA